MYQWDQLSKKYSFGNYTKKYIQIPGLLNNVEISKGQSLLDLGCGTGLISIIFHNEGLNVVGVDNSEQMIEIAQTQNPGPKYICDDGIKYRSKKPFDLIISNMVICNIADINTLNKFFLSCYENLKIGRKVYITHPATDFQRTVDYGFARLYYPDKVNEGEKISIELKSLDDTWIGPFINYHWSQNTITEIANDNHLNLLSIIPLLSINQKDKYPDKAKDSLYIFERN